MVQGQNGIKVVISRASQFAQTDERFGFVSMVTQELKEAINRDVTLPDDYKMPAFLKYISKSSKLCIAP